MTRDVPARLDGEAFARDGFVVVPGALPREAVLGLRRVVEDFIATGTPPTRQVLYTRSEPPEPRPGMGRLMHQWLNPHQKLPMTMRTPIAIIRDRVASLLERAPVLFQDV